MPFSNIIPTSEVAADSTQTMSMVEILKHSENIDYMAIVSYVAEGFIHLVINIAFALAVFVVGRWVVGRLVGIVDIACKNRHLDVSVCSFVKSLIKVICYIILLLIIIQILGINTTSLVAMLASAGLAVGMALSGTLQNFAGGAMILLLKPYRVGDYISTQNESGIVKEIMLFTTVLETYDRHTIFIPNSTISTSVIDNSTFANTRRVDINVGVCYGANIAHIREVAMEILAADKRIFDNTNRATAPMVGVTALADSSVNIVIRAWVKTEDYWDVFYHLNETVYETLPKRGIPFPFPQLDVHIKQS
ncbi:MAG: mechanosensitive ion channel family protein [Rikenellaceae bacterium]